MAKRINYRILCANNGEHDTELGFTEKTIECKTKADYDANYPIAEREAIGEITVDGEFEPEQDNATTDDVLNALLGVTV